MGHKLLLSFGAELQRLFDFKCEITKLPIGNVVYVSTPRWRKVLKIFMNEDVRAFKYALEKPKHTKEHIKKVLSGILSKNSNLSQNLSSKLFSAWSSQSIR